MADENFAKCTINPLTELLSEFLTIFVIPRFDQAQNLIAFIEDSSGVDPDYVLQTYQAGFTNGAVSKNEFRTNVLHLPPMEGGDVCMVNNMMVPVPVVAADEADVPKPDNIDEGDADDQPASGRTKTTRSPS